MTEPSRDLPEPLVPPDVNLRGYDFMPLYGEFLRRSAFNSRVTDAEYRAAVNLWWSSWWQIPASSLPNEEAQLCALADLGRNLRAWKKVRQGAMSGFVLCSDNRWYHSFLSVSAREVFAKRKTASIKGALGAKERWKNKEPRNGRGNSTGNSTGNATANSAGSANATENAWLADGNRSESLSINSTSLETPSPVDNSAEPHERKSTSKPPRDSKAVAKTNQLLEEQRRAAERATPPPDGFMDEWKKPVDHFAMHRDPPNPGENHDNETLDS